MLSFTDWARIRADEGLEHLTSRSPLQERLTLPLSIMTRQAAPSAFGLYWFLVHAETWGWDLADHVWEANLILDGLPPLWIIQFADWVNLEALAALFRERGFSEEILFGARVFRRPFTPVFDPAASWLWMTERAIHNTAVLFEERLLVLCTAPELVEAVLAARAGEVATWAEVPWAASLVSLLGRPSGAVVLLGPKTCLSFSGGAEWTTLLAAPGEASRRLRTLLEGGPPLQPYMALAVGYETHEGEPMGLFVLQHLTEEMAHADLPARRALAEGGVSVITGLPYRETAFTVRDARVEGTSVVLEVEPAGGRPHLLFQMVYRLDLLFATCP